MIYPDFYKQHLTKQWQGQIAHTTGQTRQYIDNRAQKTIGLWASGTEFIVQDFLNYLAGVYKNKDKEIIGGIDHVPDKYLDAIGDLIGVRRYSRLVQAEEGFILGESKLGDEDTVLGEQLYTGGIGTLIDRNYRILLKGFIIRATYPPTFNNIQYYNAIHADYDFEFKDFPERDSTKILDKVPVLKVHVYDEGWPTPEGPGEEYKEIKPLLDMFDFYDLWPRPLGCLLDRTGSRVYNYFQLYESEESPGTRLYLDAENPGGQLAPPVVRGYEDGSK